VRNKAVVVPSAPAHPAHTATPHPKPPFEQEVEVRDLKLYEELVQANAEANTEWEAA
jgi:hypothetical protein